MDELAAELAERDARGERFRYRLAAAVLFGSPLLAATITASIALTVQSRHLSRDDLFVMIAIGNAVLAAVGSGFGVWLEPGDRSSSRMAGLLGGSVFGFLLYLMPVAVVLHLIELVFTP